MKTEYYKSLIEKSPFGYALHRVIIGTTNDIIDYEYIEVNSAFESLTGLKAENVINKRSTDIFPDIKSAQFDWISCFGEVAMGGEKKVLEEYFEPLKKWYKLMIFSPEKYFFITHFENITDKIMSRLIENELRIEKKRAEEASMAKSLFLSNMSHEIRTPLNGVLGFAEILVERETDNDKKEMLEHIKYSGNTLLEIVNDVLSLAKIEAGKVELYEEEINIKKIVTEIFSNFKSIVKNGVTYSFEIEETIKSKVMGDKIKIKQILMNLLNNSRKFTLKGKIDFIVKKIEDKNTKETIRFIVKDTGIGIKKENLEKVFEKFTQENMTTSKKYGGSGLGLAIVKELVKLMKGKIKIDSEVGRGTTVTVDITFKKSKQK